MWDHPFFAPSYRVRVTTFTKFVTDLAYATGQILEALLLKKGVITNPIADFVAFEKVPPFLRSAFSNETQSKLTKFPSDWPEAEVRDSPPDRWKGC